MNARVSIAAAERVADLLQDFSHHRDAAAVRAVCEALRAERRFGREQAAKLAKVQAALDAKFKAGKSKSEQKLPVQGAAPSSQGGEAPLLSSPQQPAALAIEQENPARIDPAQGRQDGGVPVSSTCAVLATPKPEAEQPRRVAAPPSVVSNPAGGGAKERRKLDPLARRIVEIHGMAKPSAADLDPPRFTRMGVGGA